MAKIYLIPTPLSADDLSPLQNREVINSLDYFVVENIRTARRFLATLRLDRTIDQIEFVELSEHTPPEQAEALLSPVIDGGRSCGVMSEAGLPCVADPGNVLVAAAHRRGVEVVPLVGGSSIMLALMASGASGQSFAFNGYLPIKPDQRAAAIKKFERLAQQNTQTQIFIETPYRNQSLFADMLKYCLPHTILCVATDLTASTCCVTAKSVAKWKELKVIELPKSPTVFLLF